MTRYNLFLGPVVLLHVLPFSSTTREQINVRTVADEMTRTSYQLEGHHSPVSWTFEGPGQFLKVKGGKQSGVLFKRSGIVEIGSGRMLTSCGRPEIGDLDVVEICTALDRCKELLSKAGAKGPALLSIAVARAAGLKLASAEAYNTECVENLLRCPVAYIEDLDAPAHLALRTQFDAIWNAMGDERCFVFNEDGTLNVPRKRR